MKEDKISDSWCTPQDLFNVLDTGGVYQGIQFEGFNFDIDLCATKENSKVINNFGQDYLNDHYIHLGTECHGSIDWIDVKSAFMNPPYSNPKPFIEKAWEDARFCKIVLLVKCDPSTKWWGTFWNYNTPWRIEDCYHCEPIGKKWRIDCSVCSGTGKLKIVNTNLIVGPKPGCEVLFFPKRIKFDPPTGLFEEGKKTSGPTFSSALLIFDRRGI